MKFYKTSSFMRMCAPPTPNVCSSHYNFANPQKSSWPSSSDCASPSNNCCGNQKDKERKKLSEVKGEQQKTRPPKTLKCSRSKTIRPRKLKSSHHVDLMRLTWCELFSFLCLIVLDLEHFKVLGGLVFCLFTLYSHVMFHFIFLCLYCTDHFKIPSMNFT